MKTPPEEEEKDLRQRAEKLLLAGEITPDSLDLDKYRFLNQELQVHQIELELQNQELQMAHLEAEQARQRYFNLFDLAPVGFALFGDRGEILEINLAGAQLLGQERRFLINRRFQVFIAPKDVETFNRFNKSIFMSERRQSCELALEKDGIERAIVRLVGVRDSLEQQTPFCLTALLDLTEQKKSEASLAGREADLSLIMEAVPALIAYVGPDGRYRRVNQKYAQWFGTTAEEISGRHLREVLGEGQWSQIEPYVKTVLTGQKVVYERLLTLPNGENRWIQADYTPDFDAAGRLQGFVIHVMNIEERKKTEKELLDSRNDLNRAQAVAHVGSWRMDVRKNEFAWSEENYRIFGLAPGTTLTNESFWAAVHPDDRSYVDRKWQDALRGELYDIEHRIVVDGRTKWVREQAEIEFDAEGVLVGGFGTTQDITDLKSAEERLMKSEARFRLLSETAGALLASSSPQKLVEELCTRIMKHLDCQVFFNFLVDEPRGRLRLNAWAGIPEEEARKIEFLEYGVAVCGCAARDGQRIVAENIFETPDPRTELVKSYGVQAYACHPLKVGGQVLGTLSFGAKTRPTFSAEELELMKTVADQVAMAMEKIRLLEAVQTALDELEIRVRERTAELAEVNLHLAEQSQILESFFKDTITPLVLLDRNFNFIRVNEAYARACQRDVEDFPGLNHFQLFPHEENLAIFKRVAESGIPYQASAKPFYYPEHPEWGVTYWDWVLTPLPDEHGKTAFLVFSLEEVTDRQKAEEALRNSERQLRSLADQLLYAQENERKRIARDMHDSLGASLSALKYKMEDLFHNLPDRDSQKIEEKFSPLISILQDTIGEARRMQNALRPPLLDDLGILPTLSWFSREFQKIYPGIAIEQRLEVREEDVPELLKVMIFRITQEALNNVGRHARATQVRVYLGREKDCLRLTIRDNGLGFDQKEILDPSDQWKGMGLSSMKERAELSGGAFSLETRPEQGAVIEVTWPLNKRGGMLKKGERQKPAIEFGIVGAENSERKNNTPILHHSDTPSKKV